MQGHSDEKHFIRKNAWFDKMMTQIHQADYHYKRGVGVTQQYIITEECTHCGTCEKVCPTQNIHLIEGRPVFESDCPSCLACTQNCPSNAIRLNSENSTKRYRNETIKLYEIIQANQ